MNGYQLKKKCRLTLSRNETTASSLGGYQLKAGQVTSWQITRTLRQAQGTSPSVDSGQRPSVDSGHRFLSLSKGAGE
ncbi:MAG TPA: hypothetical protein ENJ51_04695 [Leucothrix mucor]|uniref:Uncharacterized protein n=1 Tax=Leucothrix mucor TaxID=45248 RepID=A0A7V2WUW4_LEUMU|nr:hypothetical protein [Leucothrix mucor]